VLIQFEINASVATMSREADRRRLAALKRLAERPGTPAEGEAAQAAIDRLQARGAPAQPAGAFVPSPSRH
jgi:hypothetical protein